MRQHYKPMLAQQAKGPFTSKDWIFEIKWDGIRAISYINNNLSIRSRNDKELRYNFPELQELKNLANNIVVDGEIVVVREGKADFQSILERRQATSTQDIENRMPLDPTTYVVFDILEKDGEPLIGLPLMERRRILSQRLKESEHVALSIFVEEQGEAYYEIALRKGMEGVMAKRKDSLYFPGVRSNDWLKIKKILTCDCAIFGYTTGEGSRGQTFGALILGLYDSGKPVYVGKVGTGFSRNDLQLLANTFNGLETEEKTLEGVDVLQKITWLKPQLVCEVVYQTVTRGSKLRMPRFQRLRADKTPPECTLEQIMKSNLEEYRSKRNFSLTSEPKGGDKEVHSNIFVVQEHHARKLHYDLRLEKEGSLKSWAVPKGIPEKNGDKRLAIQTENHPLEYSEFEGTIPKGQYGAGTVRIWDNGVYEPKIWKEDMIEFTLNGRKLHGRYVLARFKKAGEKQWVLLKTRV
jgi:DNA ligase D-like protein (predicted ligase)/DNA ligase D-like protein (predicted 3'-phosphoesterase)